MDHRQPPNPLVTAVFALIFQNDCLLMTQLATRGWQIPGGHVEDGESLEMAVRREIYEETAVHVSNLHIWGYDKFVIQSAMPPAYKYPFPESYQVGFIGNVTLLDPFVPTDEAAARKLMTPAEVRETTWGKNNEKIYQAALNTKRLFHIED
ncbi:MAG: NUDIX domain-containing protein [Anaerolineae bacterium]|nr:NUDIX domain-containing protein [Anaerolineae bacterium]